MLDKALNLRPCIPILSIQVLSIQLIHGVTQDGLPISLPANDNERWKDEPYAVVSELETHGDAIVCLFGITKEGNSCMVTVEGYRPYIRVELSLNSSTRADAEALRLKIERRFKCEVTLEMEVLKRFYGWVNVKGSTSTQKYTYALFRFSSWKQASSASYFIEKEGYLVTDKQVKPLSRFLNDLKITPSDWITLQCPTRLDNKLQRTSNCQMEFTCHVTKCVPIQNDLIAPLLVMSFDGEMYSHDGSFPSTLKGDSTIFIGASFWTYGTPITEITRFIVCVGNITIPEDTNIIIKSFKSKKEMIEGFRDLVVAADPDIVTGWNTYGFDYSFLHEDYTSDFLMPWERGSEELQVAAMHTARSVMGLETCIIQTSAELLSKARSLRGHFNTKDWLKKNERKFGGRNISTLLKLERVSGASVGQNSLTNYGVTSMVDLIDEEDEDEIGIMGLSASVGILLRSEIRAFMVGDQNAAKTSTSNFTTVLEDATKEQLNEFWKRMSIHGSSTDLLKFNAAPLGAKRGLYLGRFASERSHLIEKRMMSAAKGDNTYYFWNMTGRINIDLMQIIKDDKKPEINTLKFAAEHWLGGGSDVEKMDLSASEMFAIYKNQDPDKCYEIAKYCARDCDIPILLISKLSYIPTWIEMSRVCYTWPHEIVNSGQQVKVFNLISRFVAGEYALNVRDSGWPTNSYDEFDEDEMKKRKPDYQGATVIEPIAGFYEDCISTLDFESLYPSIIRYFNLCPSVLVLDDDVLNTHNLSVETHEIDHNILVNKQYENQKRKYTFVNHVQGVLPKLLKRLLDARKAVKKMMVDTTDPLQKAILNGRQNGIKIACNSVYGFCGVSADKGLLPCKPVAAVTTLKGRAFIEAAKNYVEKTYEGSKVIYGDTDSVMIFWGKGVEVKDAAKMGEEAADAITDLLRSGAIADIGGAGSIKILPLTPQQTKDSSPPRDLSAACSAVTLAYEKTYRPYLLLKKKNYAGLKYSGDGKGGFKTEIDMKGIDAVRRDRPKLLRDTSNAILQALLYNRSVPQAIKALDESLTRIASDGTPLEDFVLSKSLKGQYSSNNLPHVQAWKKMGDRGEEQPPIGSRMPYIVVVDKSGTGGKKSASKLYERTEHPSWVLSQKLKVDRQYYVETLQNPITKLLQFVVTEIEIKNIFRDAIECASNTSSGIGSLLTILSNSSSNEKITTRIAQPLKSIKKRKSDEIQIQTKSLKLFFS